jgi:hypothetical protein
MGHPGELDGDGAGGLQSVHDKHRACAAKVAAGADGASITSRPSLFDRQISASMRFQGRAARA